MDVSGSAVSSPTPTAKPKRNVSPPIVDIAPKEVLKDVVKEVSFSKEKEPERAQEEEPLQETPKKADSDSDEFEFMDAKSGKKYTPAAKKLSSTATPSSERSVRSDVSDMSATSPFAGLGLDISVVSEREASPPVKKEKKVPMIPALALPAKGTAVSANTYDEFEAPPSKRREDATGKDNDKDTDAHDDEFDFTPTPSSQPAKPVKPAKAPTPAVAETLPSKPEKTLTAKERLALRREQLKDQKEKANANIASASASATKKEGHAKPMAAAVASPAPTSKSPKSPSGESVHEFEEYGDSFEN